MNVGLDRMSESARRNLDAFAYVGVFLGFFLLYARTVSPGVLDADGGEFQTNIYRLGVSHTGYPLYFLIAKAWTLIWPLGSVAYRANLFSSFCGALAASLLYFTMRGLFRSRAAAFGAAVLFGLSRVEWSQALIPDVYTLNSFLLILVLPLATLARQGRVRVEWVLFAYGLSLAHHRTMIWIGPALALWLLLIEGRALLQPTRLVRLALAFLIPLLLYLYIPLRGDSDVGVEYHARNFTEMILASNVSVWLRFGPPGFIWERITTVYLPLMVEQFTPFGFALGLFGLGALVSGRAPRGFPSKIPPRQWALFIGLAHIGETAFAIVLWVVDSEIFFIPSYLTFMFFVGVGLAFAFDWASDVALRLRYVRFPLPLASSALAAALAAAALYLGLANFQRVDRSWDDDAQTRWQGVLSQLLEPGAVIAGNWESLTPFEYMQYVEGKRTDLKKDKLVIYRDQLRLAPQGDVAGEFGRSLDRGQAVYLTLHPDDAETLGDISRRFQVVSTGSLWRVQPQEQFQLTGVSARFGEQLQLVRVGISSLQPQPGDWVTLQLEWRALGTLSHSYNLLLRLRDSRGRSWVERELAPEGGRSSTLEWQAGRDIGELEGFFVPPDAPPDEYTLSLSLVDVASRQLLKTDEGDQTRIAEVSVSPAAHAGLPINALNIEHLVSLGTPLGKLVGWHLGNENLKTGDTVELDTWWQLAENGDLEFRLHDAAGREYLVLSSKIFAGPVMPAFIQIARARHELQIPPNAAAGRAILDLVIQGQSYHLLDLDLAPGGRVFERPNVARADGARFGDSIQLIGYNQGQTQGRPGESVSLTLVWQALTRTQKSYKVFVHLLRPDGALAAQQDSYPHNGELTTDRWLEGEYITDEYHLLLPPDINPGDYRFEIGLYDEGSGARLPIRDVGGTPRGDARILDTLLRVLR